MGKQKINKRQKILCSGLRSIALQKLNCKSYCYFFIYSICSENKKEEWERRCGERWYIFISICYIHLAQERRMRTPKGRTQIKKVTNLVDRITYDCLTYFKSYHSLAISSSKSQVLICLNLQMLKSDLLNIRTQMWMILMFHKVDEVH